MTLFALRKLAQPGTGTRSSGSLLYAQSKTDNPEYEVGIPLKNIRAYIIVEPPDNTVKQFQSVSGGSPFNVG